VLRELHEKAPDGGTHSATAYTLIKWGQPPDPLPPSDQPPADCGWFVNKLGMTMIKIEAGDFLMGSDDLGTAQDRVTG